MKIRGVSFAEPLRSVALRKINATPEPWGGVDADVVEVWLTAGPGTFGERNAALFVALFEYGDTAAHTLWRDFLPLAFMNRLP
jgi:hypothetical protein